MSTELIFGRKFKLRIHFIGLIVAVFLVWSCGASRQDSNLDEDNIDLNELLGDEQSSNQESGSEESEVLRLLGITPVKNASQATEETTIPEETKDSSIQVDQLTEEINQKDREISDLRSELTQKESKISELESQQRSSSAQRPFIGRSVKFGEPSAEFKSQYQLAINQFNSRNYQGALTAFSNLLLSDPNNSLSDNCQYWIGECYYGQSNYNQAIAEFEKVFSFPNSNKSDDAQLKLGLSYLKLGDKQQSRAEFDRLIANYPDSEYASLAQRYLGRL